MYGERVCGQNELLIAAMISNLASSSPQSHPSHSRAPICYDMLRALLGEGIMSSASMLPNGEAMTNPQDVTIPYYSPKVGVPDL